MDKTLNILIIEDNSDDAYLIKALLEHEDFNFQSKLVSEKQELVDTITTQKFDIILTDNSMYRFNSQDVLNILKEHKINTPLIILSGTVTDKFASDMIKQGAFDYVNKNDFKQITASIQKAVSIINF